MIAHNEITDYRSFCEEGASGSRWGAVREEAGAEQEAAQRGLSVSYKLAFSSSSHNRESLKDFIQSNIRRPD